MKKTTEILAVIALLAAVGCSKSSDKADKPSPNKAPETTEPDKPAEPVAKPSEAAAGIAPILSEYESIRAELAADKSDAVATHAKTLGRLAGSAEVSEAAKPHMAPLATAADELAKTDPGDMPAVRLAFGAVSEKLIAALEAEPSYAEGLHTFECPMAKGYKLWVQPDPKLENPYMGQKMLSCGAEVTPE